MLALWNQFDDLFNSELAHEAHRARRASNFVPAVDIEETKDGYVLTADLPGLTSEDVEITLEHRVLTISGERKAERVDDKKGYRRVERSFGAFRRSFTLPEGVDVEGVKAVTEHGQVKVTVPKPVAALPRKIKIQASDKA